MRPATRYSAVFLATAALLTVAGMTLVRVRSGTSSLTQTQRSVSIPVEVSPVVVRSVSEHKSFSATLEASSRVVIAPKIQGRIRRLHVDLGDEVGQGQIVAELDSAEFEQEVLQAKAEFAVAEAQLVASRNALSIAERELARIEALHERRIASDAQLDTAMTQKLTADASVQVAEAQVNRSRSLVESAQIRLGYASIRADWTESDESRLVSERFVDEGDTVGANSPIVAIVELSPMNAVIYVTERDYPALTAGQRVSLTTDAFPGRAWDGAITRISPVFREGSRQARIEIRVLNEDRDLKPGMFARVDTVLRTVEQATVVPASSLIKRENADAVFVLDAETMTAKLVPVTIGIRDGESVQIIAEGIVGERVVTLGQHLLSDGVPISVEPGPDDSGPAGTVTP